jgi:hypothetical protein
MAIDGIFDQAGVLVVVIRVAEGATDAETQANVIGGVDEGGQYLGLQALLAAQSVAKVTATHPDRTGLHSSAPR